jgi:hypothetical protein
MLVRPPSPGKPAILSAQNMTGRVKPLDRSLDPVVRDTANQSMRYRACLCGFVVQRGTRLDKSKTIPSTSSSESM